LFNLWKLEVVKIWTAASVSYARRFNCVLRSGRSNNRPDQQIKQVIIGPERVGIGVLLNAANRECE
jgi:hypothetical protein